MRSHRLGRASKTTCSRLSQMSEEYDGMQETSLSSPTDIITAYTCEIGDNVARNIRRIIVHNASRRLGYFDRYIDNIAAYRMEMSFHNLVVRFRSNEKKKKRRGTWKENIFERVKIQQERLTSGVSLGGSAPISNVEAYRSIVFAAAPHYIEALDRIN